MVYVFGGIMPGAFPVSMKESSFWSLWWITILSLPSKCLKCVIVDTSIPTWQTGRLYITFLRSLTRSQMISNSHLLLQLTACTLLCSVRRFKRPSFMLYFIEYYCRFRQKKSICEGTQPCILRAPNPQSRKENPCPCVEIILWWCYFFTIMRNISNIISIVDKRHFRLRRPGI